MDGNVDATSVESAASAAEASRVAPPPADRKKAKKARKESKPILGSEALRTLKNDVFTAYYQKQLALSEEEWATFEACMRTPLPVTFRFGGFGEHSQTLRSDMERVLLPSLGEHGVAMPVPLPWYPGRLAWQVNVSRARLRGKDYGGADEAGDARTDAVKHFHAWLIRETEIGRVHRQEAVSMVPPLLLDVQPGHTVLDMCASPGSKTQQILELLAHRVDARDASSGAKHGANSDAAPAAGLVIANDADIKRCHLLASRAAKLHSPSLIVANHDARLLPETLDPANGTACTPLRFDRILADVPCSGDGTLRKNPLIWKRWQPANANMLHALQLQIACKGVRLTKAGGRFVYSTCSLNPIENEAVVARVLTTFGTDCVRLVDVSAELPGLARGAGVTNWEVFHRGQWHPTWASVEERFPSKTPFKLESLFPPVGGVEGLHLERCLRMMPHMQDCGAFFVAVFEKLAPHADEAGLLPDSTPEVCVAEGGAVLPEALSLSGGKGGAKDAGGDASAGADAVSGTDAPPAATAAALDTNMCSQHAGIVHAHGGATVEAAARAAEGSSYAPLFMPRVELTRGLHEYFGLTEAFPYDRLVARSPTARSLLLLSKEIVALLRADGAGALKVVNTGVRLFEREEAKGLASAYRVCQDGLHHLLPWLTRQRVQCSPGAATRVLAEKQLAAADIEAFEPELAASLRAGTQPGSVVLSCAPAGDGPPVHVVAMYAPSGNLCAMVKGLERQALHFHLGAASPSTAPTEEAQVEAAEGAEADDS